MNHLSNIISHYSPRSAKIMPLSITICQYLFIIIGGASIHHDQPPVNQPLLIFVIAVTTTNYKG